MFSLFSIYTLILLFRLAIYLNLTLAKSKLNLIKTDKEIPLYISEIAMAIMIILLLFKSSINSNSDEDESKID